MDGKFQKIINFLKLFASLHTILSQYYKSEIFLTHDSLKLKKFMTSCSFKIVDSHVLTKMFKIKIIVVQRFFETYNKIQEAINKNAPSLLIAVMSISSAIFVLSMPETKDQSLPEDLDDFKSGPFWNRIFSKSESQKTPSNGEEAMKNKNEVSKTICCNKFGLE